MCLTPHSGTAVHTQAQWSHCWGVHTCAQDHKCLCPGPGSDGVGHPSLGLPYSWLCLPCGPGLLGRRPFWQALESQLRAPGALRFMPPPIPAPPRPLLVSWLPEPMKEARSRTRGGPTSVQAPRHGLAVIPRVSVSAQPLVRQPDGRFSRERKPDVPFQTDFTAGLRRAPASS